MKQKVIELKGKIEKSTSRVGDFNIPLSVTNRTTRILGPKISRILRLHNKQSRAEVGSDAFIFSAQGTDRWSTSGPCFTIIKRINIRIHKKDKLYGEIQIIKRFRWDSFKCTAL